MSKGQNKTQESDSDVAAFLESVEHPTRRADAISLDQLFQKITGFSPRMWGASLVGYGRYHYTYASGREGDSLATGFSPRKAALSIYVMPGYGDYEEILNRLGKYKKGKACLFINKLDDVDVATLEEIIRAGLRDLDQIWPVEPT